MAKRSKQSSDGDLTPEQQRRAQQLERRCFDYREIAEQINSTTDAVKCYFRLIASEAQRGVVFDRQVELWKHLRNLEEVRNEAWLAWDRSTRKKVTVSETAGVSGNGPTSSRTKTRQTQPGDPRFLDIINKCLQQAAKLLGLEHASERSAEIAKAAQEIARERDRLRNLGYGEDP